MTAACLFFFFKQKTAYEITRRDWSSDVCSSDLGSSLPRIQLALAHAVRVAADQLPQRPRIGDVVQHQHRRRFVRRDERDVADAEHPRGERLEELRVVDGAEVDL